MENQYVNYQNMVTTVMTGITGLEKICSHISMETQGEDLDKLGVKMKNHVFSVGIMGEFKRGKSTVINALLGQEIVPADIMPCSATLNYIRWDTEKRAEILFKDGSKKVVPVDEMTNYITKITDESAEMASSVEEAAVYYPCTFCQNGVQIVDTPGLNDDERMNEISERVIPTLDAIIMVVVPGSPFSQTEADFVRNKVMSSDLGRIIFLFNKIDTVRASQRERAISGVLDRIRKSVLDKMAAIHGEDSEEYKNAKSKMGNIKLIPVSALDCLDGKLENDQELIEKSGYMQFEKALANLLTEERGMLELLHPVNQLMSVSKEALQNMNARLSAMKMDADEFAKTQNEQLRNIEETRERKKQEIRALKNKGKTLYADLVVNVSSFYDDMEQALQMFVGGCDITDADLSTQESLNELTARLSSQINHEIEEQLSNQLERLHVNIEQQLGKDIKEFEQVSIEISSSISDIRLSIGGGIDTASAAGSTTALIGGAVAEGVANVALAATTETIIPGIGGIIAGYREHGLKGAAVGGVAGAGLSIATILAAGSIGLAGLPVAVLGGIVASFGGRAVVRKVFGKKDTAAAKTSPDMVRSMLGDSVSKTVRELRSQYVIENWLKNSCEKAYSTVADDIDHEWENTLHTLEETMSQIKIDIQMNSENRASIEKELGGYIEEINGIIDSILPIKTKLNESLNKIEEE